MASDIHMPKPICLIENTEEQLVVNPEALGYLSAIKEPVVVVAIVGFYRTGKSYLMNKLAGKNAGFSLGSTVQSHTKGIWMWCVPHPQKPGHTLVLLDTGALKMLRSYVTELTDLIKSKSSPEQSGVDDSANFVGFFPIFVWALRDFSLELEANGKPITADEYLEHSLTLKKGSDDKIKSFNEPRLCIRKFFPKRKCFVFDRPAQRKYLSKLETMKEEDLSEEFVEQVREFTSYIFSSSDVKTLSGGIIVNGPRLQSLVLTYVNAIRSGELPCMENAVLTLAQIENSAAVQKAIEHYEEQMNHKVRLPTESLQELLDLQRPIESEAIEVFIKNSFKDVDQKFQKELGALLDAKLEAFIKKNMDMSSARCSDLLEDIFGPLEKEVKEGTFSKPGGYYLFLQKKQELEKKYNQIPGKGLQAEKMLKKYFDSKDDVAETLLKADQSLTEAAKEIEVERIKAEAAEAANRDLEEKQKKYELMMQQKEESYQEHVKQLTLKMQQEREQLIREQDKIISLKLQEQKRLLNEGFQNESRKLHQEMESLKKSKPSGGCTIL